MNEFDILEKQLDNFSEDDRKTAFLALMERLRAGHIAPPLHPFRMNLHYHSFFSFNALGYSPLHIVWRAKKEGLGMAGGVDFDVLDAVEELFWGALEAELPVVAGMETRIFLPEFRTEELSSPREPGVAYYMGNGFTRLPQAGTEAFRTLAILRETAQARNRKVIDRINVVGPVMLDFDRDVVPLTPAGNVTERHIIQALIFRVESVFPNSDDRIAYWSGKLAISHKAIEQAFNNQPDLADLVRMKLLKHGGMAYIEAGEGDFPRIETVNALIEEMGAIPSFSWLDGTSNGEKDPNKLLEFCQDHGVESFFMVPDRNWNVPDEEERRQKVANFHRMVGVARDHHMPVFVGTEMNKNGQKFVDDFDSPYLCSLSPHFFESAWVLWGHSVLELSSRRGYGSDWARRHFRSRSEKNRFYSEIGKGTPASRESINRLGQLTSAQVLMRGR